MGINSTGLKWQVLWGKTTGKFVIVIQKLKAKIACCIWGQNRNTPRAHKQHTALCQRFSHVIVLKISKQRSLTDNDLLVRTRSFSLPMHKKKFQFLGELVCTSADLWRSQGTVNSWKTDYLKLMERPIANLLCKNRATFLTHPKCFTTIRRIQSSCRTFAKTGL